ncbi:SDR family NAD(P)-dependent oxidoreductase [Streptantibioticus rubrisoli]|uniref:SDR family oxidoreductase n=1 Tax=Streptantibioticus rubrisoli TaxID=1387313 RepID=A0ABT1PGK0_9ACTN|nr:SDR family NAD(P)-dependent oxidoreductase [Streptantibioticus rubrisoli]MCQ4044502.1 SDR family oxidoreductase [Streptantibioticus rubrisoli]
MQLDGRTAVITGGGRGLGRHVAEALAAAGAVVVAAGRNPGEWRTPAGVATLKADVTVPESMTELMATVQEQFGGPHIVVANAGVSRPGPVAALAAEHWGEVIDTNLNGVFHTVRAAIPYLKESPGGRVITLSSLIGRRPMPGAAAYCASKAAVEMFTQVCALELGPLGITANCLSPGFIDAGMGRQLMANEALWGRFSGALAAGRPGTGEEVGKVAVFLASQDSSYVNGHVLNVDGGVGW